MVSSNERYEPSFQFITTFSPLYAIRPPASNDMQFLLIRHDIPTRCFSFIEYTFKEFRTQEKKRKDLCITFGQKYRSIFPTPTLEVR